MPLVISSSRRQPPVDYYTQPNIMVSRSNEYVMGSGLSGEWLGPFSTGGTITANSATGVISDDNDNWMRSVSVAQGNARTYLNTSTTPDRLDWEENNVDAIGNGGAITYDKTLGRWVYMEDSSDSWYSTDYGDTWNAGGTPAWGSNGSFNDRNVVMVTTGGATQIFTTEGLRVEYTSNGGGSWALTTNASWTISAMTYNPFDDRLWIVHSGDGSVSSVRRGVWYLPRTSLGGSWTQSLNLSGAEEGRGIDVNTNNGTICAGFNDPNQRIWRKPLGGSWSFTELTGMLSNVQSVTYVPQVNRWFAWDIGDRQIWASDDDGVTWALDTTFPDFSGTGTVYIEHRTRATMHDF